MMPLLRILASLPLIASTSCSSSVSARAPRETETSLFAYSGADSLAKLPIACGQDVVAARSVVLVSGEQCFSCLQLARAMREAARAAPEETFRVLTKASDTSAVCAHLRREGLGWVNVAALRDSQWKAPWPPGMVWVAVLDTGGAPKSVRAAPQASSSLLR